MISLLTINVELDQILRSLVYYFIVIVRADSKRMQISLSEFTICHLHSIVLINLYLNVIHIATRLSLVYCRMIEPLDVGVAVAAVGARFSFLACCASADTIATFTNLLANILVINQI